MPAARTESHCPGSFSVDETPPLFCLSFLLFLHLFPPPRPTPPKRKRRKRSPHQMCLSSGTTSRAELPHPWTEPSKNAVGKTSARSTRHFPPSTADQGQTQQHFSVALLRKQKEISPQSPWCFCSILRGSAKRMDSGFKS